MPDPVSLILCCTPRVGSTLVCSLLASSRVAGVPESWYRAEDRADYAQDWGLAVGPQGQVDPAAYLAAARLAGQTPNGVTALRIQASTLVPLLAELRGLFPDAAGDAALLEQAFGRCRYLYMWREDLVAQAVSRLRAEQSQIWHRDGGDLDRSPAEPHYDAARIAGYVAEAEQGNAMWRRWFDAIGLAPLTLTYEALALAPVTEVQAILHRIGLAATAAPLQSPNRRMADEINADWARRYRLGRG